MSEFTREPRYIVIKRSDLNAIEHKLLHDFIDQHLVKIRDCVVVEADWPEYEPTWKAIEKRCNPDSIKSAASLKLLPCPLCGEQHVNLRGYADSDGQFVECPNCGVTVDVLPDLKPWNTRAEIERLKGGQGEPVAQMVSGSEGNCCIWFSRPADGTNLYASQPAPVSAVIPERMVIPEPKSNLSDMDMFDYEVGFNACLDKVKEMNG